MGKGFDAFMINPYWRARYENAPSDAVREYYRRAWECSPFVLSGTELARMEKIIDSEAPLKLTIQDYEFLMEDTSGMERWCYKKKIERMKAELQK